MCFLRLLASPKSPAYDIQPWKWGGGVARAVHFPTRCPALLIRVFIAASMY